MSNSANGDTCPRLTAQVYRLEGIVADRPALEAAKFAAAALKNVRKFAGDVDLVGGRGGGGGGGGGRLKLRLAKLGGGQQKAERAADPELTTSLFDGGGDDGSGEAAVGYSRYGRGGRAGPREAEGPLDDLLARGADLMVGASLTE